MCSINLKARAYIDENGVVCEITNMIDAWGEETDEIDMVCVIVAKRAEDEWRTIAMDGFETSGLQ